MKITVAGLLLAVAFAAANPVIGTIINEIGYNADSTAWIELHPGPFDEALDLANWQIVTATSACTLDCVLYYGDFLVLDSALLGEGLYGRGTFRLNPGSDSIHVRTTGQYPPDWLFYGPGHPLTPAPSLSASTSVWNEACYENQSITYYADSTPTPGHENDDFCSISGTVATQGGESLSYAAVTASGQHGQASACSWDGNRYAINGLQPGVYWVGCDAHMLSGAQYYATYPDSVVVGYSQYVTGIDFLFPPTGVAEQPGPAGQRSEPGPTVLPDAAKLVLYDVRGRRVRNPGPGVYFVREQGRVRKVIVTR